MRRRGCSGEAPLLLEARGRRRGPEGRDLLTGVEGGVSRAAVVVMAPLSLGRVVATPGALETILGVGGDPFAYVARHASGNWGELCAHDRHENGLALRHGRRVLSSYGVGGSRVWVITEADRSVTTILLPEEY